MSVPLEAAPALAEVSTPSELEARRALNSEYLRPHPAEVARFYRAQLARRGFVERPESARGLLAFVNGREQISVAMQSLEEERGAAVFVTRLEGAQ